MEGQTNVCVSRSLRRSCLSRPSDVTSSRWIGERQSAQWRLTSKFVHQAVTFDEFFGRTNIHCPNVIVQFHRGRPEVLIQILEDSEEGIEFCVDKHDVPAKFQSTIIINCDAGDYFSAFTSSALPGVCDLSMVKESRTRLQQNSEEMIIPDPSSLVGSFIMSRFSVSMAFPQNGKNLPWVSRGTFVPLTVMSKLAKLLAMLIEHPYSGWPYRQSSHHGHTPSHMAWRNRWACSLFIVIKRKSSINRSRIPSPSSMNASLFFSRCA